MVIELKNGKFSFMKYTPVIGLEIHAALKTKTKMFCDSLNDPDEKHPNVNVCPVCMAHPGTLPVINEEAVKKVILAGLALNCAIARDTFFERKNYFYPDLPKGYQISQYQKPLCEKGWLDIDNPSTNAQGSKRIRITRIHLEEDAGRLYHLPGKDYSLVDYNRAGVPLMELVTEPDFESGEEVKKFAEELQLIFKYLGVSDADMEKGLMRVEVNISLMESPSTSLGTSKLGTKVEIKNLNSIRAAADSVDYEIKRQSELLERGEKIVQETRGWDDAKRKTVSQRSKEEAHDYRYFPEPDLPPLYFSDKYIQGVRGQLVELPEERRQRFIKQYGLLERDIEVFVTNKKLGDFFEHVASEIMSFDKLQHLKQLEAGHTLRLLKLTSNYLITEFQKLLYEVSAEPDETKVTPEMFADMIARIFHAEVSSTGAQVVLREMFESGLSPAKIIEEKDLAQVSDLGSLEAAVDKAIADNPKAADDFKKGKEASLKFLIGMVMRESKGKANPQVVEQIIREKLK